MTSARDEDMSFMRIVVVFARSWCGSHLNSLRSGSNSSTIATSVFSYFRYTDPRINRKSTFVLAFSRADAVMTSPRFVGMCLVRIVIYFNWSLGRIGVEDCSFFRYADFFDSGLSSNTSKRGDLSWMNVAVLSSTRNICVSLMWIIIDLRRNWRGIGRLHIRFLNFLNLSPSRFFEKTESLGM